ncbi:MAG: GNAT family N-acetyltransferase [Phycisphaerales bacterium]|nr:GNAT family N-acetyltransferase [Phycisphaerales bacterium]
MSALATLQQQINRLSAGRVHKSIHAARPVEVLPKPDLSTELLSFRPLALGDRPVFIDAFERSLAQIEPWIPMEPSAEAFFESLVTKGVEGDAQQTAWRRAAFLNDGRFLGMFNLIKIERGLSWSAEANWWVDSRLSGLGLGTHAIRAMVDHALSDIPIGFGLHALRANISPENQASMRVAEKLGFKATGEREPLEINGRLVDHTVFTVDAIA